MPVLGMWQAHQGYISWRKTRGIELCKSRFGVTGSTFSRHPETRKVNLSGVYLGCKYACAQFLKQELNESGRRGWIVNVSSMLGYVGIKGGTAAYCASKGAVLNLTKQIAIDYAQDRIHCNALCPGCRLTSPPGYSPGTDTDTFQSPKLP